MRVTKIIREYVEKKVRENYPKSPAEIKWQEEQDKMSKAVEEADALVSAYARSVAEEFNKKYGFSEEYKLKAYEHYTVVNSTREYDCDLYQQASKARSERSQAINHTIEDILVSLELGGTRAELEERLANIGK